MKMNELQSQHVLITFIENLREAARKEGERLYEEIVRMEKDIAKNQFAYGDNIQDLMLAKVRDVGLSAGKIMAFDQVIELLKKLGK
jgi:hypothetical protein